MAFGTKLVNHEVPGPFGVYVLSIWSVHRLKTQHPCRQLGLSHLCSKSFGSHARLSESPKPAITPTQCPHYPGAPNSPKEVILIYFKPQSKYYSYSWSHGIIVLLHSSESRFGFACGRSVCTPKRLHPAPRARLSRGSSLSSFALGAAVLPGTKGNDRSFMTCLTKMFCRDATCYSWCVVEKLKARGKLDEVCCFCTLSRFSSSLRRSP